MDSGRSESLLGSDMNAVCLDLSEPGCDRNVKDLHRRFFLTSKQKADLRLGYLFKMRIL